MISICFSANQDSLLISLLVPIQCRLQVENQAQWKYASGYCRQSLGSNANASGMSSVANQGAKNAA